MHVHVGNIVQTVTIVITYVLRYLPISLQFADIEDIGAALGGITNRLNSLLKKMDAAKTQSEEESTSLRNAS